MALKIPCYLKIIFSFVIRSLTIDKNYSAEQFFSCENLMMSKGIRNNMNDSMKIAIVGGGLVCFKRANNFRSLIKRKHFPFLR